MNAHEALADETPLAMVRQRLREVVNVLEGKPGYEGIDPIGALVFLTGQLADDGFYGRALAPPKVLAGADQYTSEEHLREMRPKGDPLPKTFHAPINVLSVAWFPVHVTVTKREVPK